MGLSVQHLLVVLVVGLLFFGRGKISELMGEVGKGIKSFKRGLADDTSLSARTGETPLPFPGT